eukprot:m.92657 g.92657  ORF g.92657 m.92657 type:complete len:94 (+) comp16521_c0_seq28:1782-2063(+)
MSAVIADKSHMISHLVCRHGAAVNACNRMGYTAALLAAARQNTSVLTVLRTFGADVDATPRNGTFVQASDSIRDPNSGSSRRYSALWCLYKLQ